MTARFFQAARERHRQLILVPNQRRADLELAGYCRGRAADSAVLAPSVQTFSGWVESLALRWATAAGQAPRRPLDGFEVTRQWCRAIRQDGADALTEIESIASLAQAADRLLTHWGSPPDKQVDGGLWHSFRRWRRAFLEIGQDQGAASPQELLQQLAESDTAGFSGLLPEAIDLRGFLGLTPLEQRLLDRLADCGVKITAGSDDAGIRNDCKVLSFDTPTAEIAAVAGWAAEQAAGERTVAVVVNGLDQHRPRLERLFQNAFIGAGLLRYSDPLTADFHILSGRPLAGFDAPADALRLLKLSTAEAGQRFDIALWSRLLLSSSLRGANREQSARAKLEWELRAAGYARLSIGQVLAIARRAGPADGTPTLQALLTSIPPVEAGATPVEHMAACLNHWGWPGPVAGAPHTRSMTAAVTRLLDRLQSYRPDSPAEARRWLGMLMADTRLPAAGGPLSAVQVITPEDAVGLSVDAAWVINLRQQEWPAPCRPNPLIPSAWWPRIPRSTSESEWAYTRDLTRALQRIAPEVRFSWSRYEEEVGHRASVFLDGMPDAPAAPASDGSLAGRIFETMENDADAAHLEALDDDRGNALAPGALPGSSQFIRDQAWSPLGAYLHHRLHARHRALPGPFPDAAMRGRLVHKVLEELYGPQRGKIAIPADQNIDNTLEIVFNNLKIKDKFSVSVVQAEQRRLHALMLEWLQLDRCRAPFELAAVEQRMRFERYGYLLDIRMDRMDRLSDGRFLVIDYKTGQAGTAGWAGERLLDPQLPLYVNLLDSHEDFPIVGAVFARVKTGHCRYVGVADTAELNTVGIEAIGHSKRTALTRRFADWSEMMAHWQRQIDGLLAEIAAGCCDNRIYDEKPLAYSDLLPVLRVEEAIAWRAMHRDA